MKNGGDVTITVTGVFDAQGNPIGQPNSGTHIGGGVGGIPPMLASIEVLGPRQINVIFSEAMKETEPGSVLNPANYRWWVDTPPGNAPTNVNKIAEFPPTYSISWTTGTGISEGQEVTVQVSNVQDLAGNVIDPLHNTASDVFEVTLPRALSLTAVNERTLKIKFSKDMGSSALFVGNYTIDNPPGASGKGTLAIHPSRVVEDTEPRTYILEWDTGEMKGGSLVQIQVQNVKDIYGNLIDPNWDTVVCPSLGVSPYVFDVRVIDSKKIRVLFSEAMEPYMILTSRYSLSGPGKGTLSTNPSTVQKVADGNYVLNWDTGSLLQGEDITITVLTGADLAGNPLVEPKSKTVSNRIKITTNLYSRNVYIGDPFVLSFYYTGGEGEMHFQWYKDNLPVGPNSNVWTKDAIVPEDMGEYYCVVGDSREEVVSTNRMYLGVYPHMEIIEQPQGGVVVDGDRYVLSVSVAGGIPPLTYQWFKNEENLGIDTSEFVIECMSPEDEGTYWVEISDEQESIQSDKVVIKYSKGIPVSNVLILALLVLTISLGACVELYRNTARD